ncbi:MAG: mannose-6-phosphate isomerase, class I [Azospirillaceae bacterium]|nr:mannose-6-phosphate isomerase, class I [Azospirillaceae bacterium]
MNKIFPLQGIAQNYAWGGTRYIPALIGAAARPAAGAPVAEWWLGAHPRTPSRLGMGDAAVPLDRAIAADPVGLLGAAVARRFGRLPYLFKVLDVERMLSIQVHPDKGQAEAGFAREAGKPEAERNYRDDNHKPEMAIALSRFHMLHGFRPLGAICLHLAAYEATRDLAVRVASQGLGQGYAAVMTMPKAEVARRIGAVIASVEAWPALDEAVPEYWLLQAAREAGSTADPGLFAFFFLNLAAFEPGQAIYQPARLPHAYLRGQNVELMANSDNVLRAGLTPKHVDIPELLSVLEYRESRPALYQPTRVGAVINHYPTLCADFALDDLQFGDDARESLAATAGPEILFVLDGQATVQCDHRFQALCRGESLFVAAGTAYRIFGDAGTRLFRVQVGADAAAPEADHQVATR